jgi:hypothetical protein
VIRRNGRPAPPASVARLTADVVSLLDLRAAKLRELAAA